jgi:hypothetical protein
MKKTIAKEFLFLLGTTILFFVVVVFIWVMLTEFNNDKESELKQEIENLTDGNLKPVSENTQGIKTFIKEYLQREGVENGDEKVEKILSTYNNDSDKIIDAIGKRAKIKDMNLFRTKIYDYYGLTKNDKTQPVDELNTQPKLQYDKEVDKQISDTINPQDPKRAAPSNEEDEFTVLSSKEADKVLAALSSKEALEKELEKTKKSFFNERIGGGEVLGLGIILFSIFFLLRYLIYGTKWSIRQLKE